MAPPYYHLPDPNAEVFAIDERRAEYINWLCGDREAGDTQLKFAERIGVAYQTLCRWKKHPKFIRAWDLKLREVIASPDRLTKILDALYTQALGGNVKAADAYFKHVGQMSPHGLAGEKPGASVEDLSDEELAAKLTVIDGGASATG